jgi:CheY-like chemotaxis protein
VANHGEEALEFLRRSELWVHQNSNPQIYENGNVHENKPVINEYFSSHEALNEVGLNAENATTATAEAEKLNVILMDLEMPVMDGLTCVRRIRELQSEGRLKRHVPVIAVTANARKDQIFRSFEAGMVSFSLVNSCAVSRGMKSHRIETNSTS